MNVFGTQFRCVRSGLTAVFVAMVSLSAFGQDKAEATTAASPSLLPQYSIISAENDSILATRLPITYNGVTYYEDVTFALSAEVNTAGKTPVITVIATPTAVASPSLATAKLVPGSYVGPANIDSGQDAVTVFGPGAISGGATEWAIDASSGANFNTNPATGTFYAGPLSSSPVAARLGAAKITDTQWNYGVSTGGSWNNICGNQLIGVEQITPTTVEVALFTGYNCIDYNQPVDTRTYTLIPPTK